MNHHIIVDVETTGLPKKNAMSFRDLDAYSTSRIVSIAFIVLDDALNEVTREYHVIKPIDFTIPIASTCIHNISHEFALLNGIDIRIAIRKCYEAIVKYDCRTFVAHNVRFDMNILLSEAYRCKWYAVIRRLFAMKRFCTMLQGRKHFGLSKIPKLKELYHCCTQKDIHNEHHAMFDAVHCSECYRYIQRNSSCVRS